MLLIPTDELRTFDHADYIHREAQSLVTGAYRKAREDLPPTAAFDGGAQSLPREIPAYPEARREPGGRLHPRRRRFLIEASDSCSSLEAGDHRIRHR